MVLVEVDEAVLGTGCPAAQVRVDPRWQELECSTTARWSQALAPRVRRWDLGGTGRDAVGVSGAVRVGVSRDSVRSCFVNPPPKKIEGFRRD